MPVALQVGNAEVVVLQDRKHKFNKTWHYPDVPEEAWEPYADLLGGPEGAVFLNFGAFMIRVDGKTILVDTGWGPDIGPPGDEATPARLLDELAEVGVGVSDIDIVAFTHLHPDHVGWNLVREGDVIRPRFDRARYLVPEGDWEHYNAREEMHPNIRQQALPLGDLDVMELIGGGHPVSVSVTTEATPGHTPGHLSFVIASGGERCFILGDLAHHPAVLQETHWVQAFDWDPEQAVATRKEVFERLERDQSLVVAGHFPHPCAGRFVRVDGRRTWKPL